MLIAKSANAFTQRFHRASGEQIGSRTIAPWIGGARNGPLKAGEDDVAKIELDGRAYRLEYEVFNLRMLGNDIRYFLMDGKATLATATGLQADNRRRWEIDIGTERFELVKRSRWRMRFVLLKDGLPVGEVRETTRFLAITRTYEITTTTALAPVIQAFLYHLAVVATYR